MQDDIKKPEESSGSRGDPQDPLAVMYEAQMAHNTPQAATKTSRTGRRIITTIFLTLILLVGAALVLWQFYGESLERVIWAESAPEDRTGQSDVYYCPMHKEYESNKPGNCPICSMKLVKKEQASGESSGSGSAPGESPPIRDAEQTDDFKDADKAASGTPEENTFLITPEQQQLIGVKSVPATSRPLEKEIRTVGKIGYDETQVTHIHTKVSGWIERAFVDFVGKFVKKGEPLFTIYSPDVVATEEEYLLALRARKELATSSFEHAARGAEDLLDATRRRLRLWDVTDQEIAALEREGKARREITVYSPVSGLVTERAAYHHGRYVTPELDLYTIVDLSKVWALGEIYEYELPLVRVGQKVLVEMPYEKSPVLIGTITYIYPYLNPATRTAQVRMEFSNPSHALKPDMFVNIKIDVHLGRQLTVPEDAVLDSGQQRYVFVDKGNGYFEPRGVDTGAQAGGFYVVKSGLKAGERVVTAANFILDSESRLKGAFANMGTPRKPEQSAGQTAQQLRIELRTEPHPAKVGDNRVRVKVADPTGTPISDASVQVKIFMPAMGSMAPMKSESRLAGQGNGEYSGTLNIPMAWTWQATVTVERAGKALGSRQLNITAR